MNVRELIAELGKTDPELPVELGLGIDTLEISEDQLTVQTWKYTSRGRKKLPEPRTVLLIDA